MVVLKTKHSSLDSSLSCITQAKPGGGNKASARPKVHQSIPFLAFRGREVLIFIGWAHLSCHLFVYLSLVKALHEHLLWSLVLPFIGVSEVMSQTRFIQIWRYFHIADNSSAIPRGSPGFDKIYRVREFLNVILRNAQRLYRLDREITIDETMVPHKGRLSFKQYIKNKPTRWGAVRPRLAMCTILMFILAKKKGTLSII